MRILLPILVFVLFRVTLFAQDLRVLWGESGVVLGEQICVTLISKELANADSLQTELSQTNEDWEYIRSEILEDRILVWVQCFALYPSLFPGLTIRYQNIGEVAAIATGPQYFYVVSPEVDLEAEPPIRGIRPPDEDDAVWRYAPFVLLVLLFCTALGFWLRKRKNKGYSLPGINEIADPWRLAMERIGQLRQYLPGDEAGSKEHVFLLNETIKQYLGGRVGYSFLEMTSAEVADAYSRFVWAREVRAEELLAWLQRGDMAKFARELPDTKELEGYINSCETWLIGAESDWQSYRKSLDETVRVNSGGNV
ncbi:MAG: hypothetical protein LBC99_05115 [Spirochaetota bacterium]|jgi:hypothetical protein|nr:hypothetical protein [Spirochaetota bacterium]